jgi:oligoribonuclease
MAQDPNYLLWIDMEMSGLSPDGDRVLEVAIVITDSQLNTVAEAPVKVVHQPDAVLDAMDSWNKSTHKKSGLIARHMPKLEAFFHYRNLDVSTLKELAKRWKPGIMGGLVKHGKHEALADIYESIEELKYYRDKFLNLA